MSEHVLSVSVSMSSTQMQCSSHNSRLPESEGGSSAEQNRLRLGLGLFEKPEKGMILHTDLPEHLAAVAAGHHELQRVLVCTLLQGTGQTGSASTWLQAHNQSQSQTLVGVTYIQVWSEFDKKSFPLETQLPHFGPVEGIDLCVTLRDKKRFIFSLVFRRT